MIYISAQVARNFHTSWMLGWSMASSNTNKAEISGYERQ